jgi:hypothetical protein
VLNKALHKKWFAFRDSGRLLVAQRFIAGTRSIWVSVRETDGCPKVRSPGTGTPALVHLRCVKSYRFSEIGSPELRYCARYLHLPSDRLLTVELTPAART